MLNPPKRYVSPSDVTFPSSTSGKARKTWCCKLECLRLLQRLLSGLLWSKLQDLFCPCTGTPIMWEEREGRTDIFAGPRQKLATIVAPHSLYFNDALRSRRAGPSTCPRQASLVGRVVRCEHFYHRKPQLSCVFSRLARPSCPFNVAYRWPLGSPQTCCMDSR